NIEDIKFTYDHMNQKEESKGAAFFSVGARQDLIISASFAYIFDDMCDVETDVEKKKKYIKIIKKYLNELFANRSPSWGYDIGLDKITPKSLPKIDWSYYKNCLTSQQFAIFRAFYRISYYYPSLPFERIVKGMDFEISKNFIFETENDLHEWYDLIGSSTNTYFILTIMTKRKFGYWRLTKEYEPMHQKVRQLGKALLFSNSVRDIFKDSEKEGRTSIPREYFESDDELRILTVDRNPWLLGEEKLQKYALRIHSICDRIMNESIDSIDHYPREVRLPSRALLFLCLKKGKKMTTSIKRSHKLSKLEKICIALNVFYVEPVLKLLKFKI
ncbi:carotenoid synthase-carotenoid cyclase-like protein, partial [Dinothrombium tinctorium]